VQRSLRQPGLEFAALSGLTRLWAAVRGCRTIGRRDLLLNDALQTISVNPEPYEVRGGSQPPTSEPADLRALAQRYFLP
jgi:urease subunit alpha